ncbi:MAG: TadE/TadG family type IV pilus assembly protein [Anaerolineae bacterium]
MKIFRHKKASQRERGQGLVEMALVLPFLLVLVVGIVEGGVALNRQLTVVNAAREGARLGANGADNEDIYDQTLLATSGMFEFTEENAVVAVIHAETDDTGAISRWTENIYPADASVPHVTPGEVEEQLNAEGDAANLKLVVVDVRYDHQSMLGMPFVGAMADQIPIGSWTVMRLPAPTHGWGSCCALPIALPAVDVGWPDNLLDIGTELVDIRQGDGPGQFGWLFWNPDPPGAGSQQTLEYNLEHPCDAWRYFKDGCYEEEDSLGPGSWIYGDTGEVSAVQGDIEALKGTSVPIPIWDQFVKCSPLPPGVDCPDCAGQSVVHIVGFAFMEITDVQFSPPNSNFTPPEKTISAKFMGMYDGCDDVGEEE